MAKKNTKKCNHEALIAGLPEDASIDRIEQHPHSIELFVSWNEPGIGERFCPSCGSSRCVKKDSGIFQTVRHLPLGIRGTLITFHKPRYRCKECGRTFYLKPKWLVKDISITFPLLLDVYKRLVSSSASIKTIATDTHTSTAIVRNIIDHFEMPHTTVLPETIGIDEFKGGTGIYDPMLKRFVTEKYHCVITDADEGFVVDVLFKPTYAYLADFFKGIPLYERQQVRFFCTDMRSGFSKVARRFFPNAKICIDPFHVTQLITKAVGTVRIDEWRRLNNAAAAVSVEASDAKENGNHDLYASLTAQVKSLSGDAALIKASQRILTTSPYNGNRYWNLDETRRDRRLDEIFAISPSLKAAYDALMDFYDVTGCNSFAAKHSALTKWLGTYTQCDLSPIRQAAYSIRYHRKGIENAWRCRKSNSPTEGLNKKIKDVKRLAFGAHDFERFRKRVMLACGADSVEISPYTIFGEKRSANESSSQEEKTDD